MLSAVLMVEIIIGMKAKLPDIDSTLFSFSTRGNHTCYEASGVPGTENRCQEQDWHEQDCGQSSGKATGDTQ